jgi:hypothetical protein
MTETRNTLPTNRAFVIQFRPADEDGQVRCEGRIEHLTSGSAELFMSRDELWAIIDHLLPDTQSDHTSEIR